MNPANSTASYLTQDQGFVIVGLRNEWVDVAMVPALGAKIVSLRNRVTGWEWMWRPPTGLKLFRNCPGDDFARSTMTGWDECLPTIASCEWQGRAQPDHGEVWSRPWDLDRAALAGGVVQAAITLELSPLRFARGLSLRGDVVVLDYRLENRGPGAVDFLWAAHPLLPVNDGTRLELTDEVRGCLSAEPWAGELTFRGGAPGCAKVYAGPVRLGRAGVVDTSTGNWLRFEWDTLRNSMLGLWLTRGGWNGHHHLALEPGNGAHDALAGAAAGGLCGRIQPGEDQSWSIQVQLGHHSLEANQGRP